MKTCKKRVFKNKTRKHTYNLQATIQIDVLRKNLHFLKKKSGTDVMPVLKANARGHGIIEIAKLCRQFGVNYIGVATLSEALQIRDSGDKGKILAWLYNVHSDEVRQSILQDIDIAIFDDTHIPIISSIIPSGKKANVHLFVDTGFNRNGILYSKAIPAALQIVQNPKYHLVGVMSHLCCRGHRETVKQFKLFRQLRQDLFALDIRPLFHISATYGILHYDNSDFDMVRSGSGFYGIDVEELQQAMTLTSTIIQLKKVPARSGIGYEHTYVTTHEQHIAIVPVGYADMYSLVQHNPKQVMVNGTYRRILGRVSMDQMVIQGKPTDKLGDTVLFLKHKNFVKHGKKLIPSYWVLGNRISRKYI
jgi:alanine racemase